MNSPFTAPLPHSNERRAQPRRTRTGGDFVVNVLTILGGMIAIAVVALVLL